MTELSDAEVFGAPKEMSDADVMGASAPGPAYLPGGSRTDSAPQWPPAALPLVNSTSVGSIMKAFGHGFGEGFGPEDLGLSKESTAWLSKKGIFAPSGQTKYENPFQAFNEGVIVNAATALDGAWRTITGTYRGLQSSGVEGGLNRDIVSIPDAFMGTPHALGQIKMRSGLPKDAPVGAPVAELSTPDPLNAFHGSPYSFEAFSTARIGSGEGAQSYGHGLYFAEHPATANQYASALGDTTVGGKPFDINNPLHKAAGLVDEFGSRKAAITETKARIQHDPGDFYGDVLGHLESSRELPKLDKTGNIYQVRINVDPGKMLDLDKPLNEQMPFVQQAVKQAMGIDYYGNFDQAKSDRIWDQFKGANAKDAVRRGFIAGDDQVVAQRLREAGIPGSKYLDEGSRIDLSQAYKTHLEEVAKNGDAEAAAQAQRELAGAENKTRNFVVFNENDIEITHKNGDPIPTPATAVAQGKDLGVIGPERPPVTEGSPKEIAERVTSANAEGPKGEKVTQELPGQKDAWQERFEGFVAKLEAPEDVKQLIRDAAKENGDFVPARQGEIPLSHVEGIADAAGISPSEINIRGLGRKLQNDNEVRIAMQMMLQVTDDVKNAAREVKADGSPESMIKLQQAIMRRDLAVEQVVGLRAEWGRTGNVIQEFTRDVKDQQGLSDFLKGRGRTPADLKDIAHTIDALDRGQSARLLNDLRTPGAWDKFRWYWVNALISGPVTHTKYAIANTAFGLYESAMVTPIAGAIGTVRRALSGDKEGVFMGEAAARTWGIIAGAPDALVAAVKAAKTGLQTPLPGEIAQNLVPKQNKNITFQQKPIGGPIGTVIGLPSRGASAIHSFFNFLGYRASIEAQAYRMAAKEGLSPINGAQRREGVVTVGYHGSHAVFDGFSSEFHGTGVGASSTAGKGHFFTTKPEVASGYAEGTSGAGNVKRVRVELQKPEIQEFSKHGITDLAGQDEELAGIIDRAKSKGRDGLILREINGESGNDLVVAFKDRAAKEVPYGADVDMSPVNESFWQRRAAYADKPTVEMMNDAIEEGYRLTFINELGDKGRKLSSFVNATKVGQLVMPFVHIPMNILKRSFEGTPVAFLDGETRDTLAGKHGAVKQEMAAARMIAGGAIGAWAVNQVLNDRMTGYGPTDAKERMQWLATGHQPYSVRIGDEWFSFNRFGPLGTMMGLYSNLAEVIPHMKPDAEELTKAIAMTVHSTGRLMEDEVGMQGLAGLIEAINEPERKGVRFVSSFAGSLLPYSSALRQVASASDPYMRQTKSVVDGLRYYIPNQRQGLEPKRDWLGAPIANAGYGGDLAVPGVSAVIQHRNAISDPISQEAAALDIRPAPPQDRIHGVKLTPKLYDTYQATAGPFLRQTLESYINQPGWHDMPLSVRQEIFKNAIKTTRSSAAAAMQMQYPQLIQQAVKDRVDKINGQKPTKLHD